MPQINAAKKALRVSARKRAVNDAWRQKVKNALLSVRDAIRDKNKPAAETAWKTAQKVLDRAARRNIMPANKAARKKSRLQQTIAKLSA